MRENKRHCGSLFSGKFITVGAVIVISETSFDVFARAKGHEMIYNLTHYPTFSKSRTALIPSHQIVRAENT